MRARLFKGMRMALWIAAVLFAALGGYGWWFHFAVGPTHSTGAAIGTGAGALAVVLAAVAPGRSEAWHTLRPLLFAPLGATGISVVAGLTTEGLTASDSVLSLSFLMGLFALGAGLVLAFPVLLFVPRLRQPPQWLAAILGSLVAWVAVHVLFGLWPPLPVLGWLWYGAMGAASGLVYAVAARKLQ